MRKYHVSSTRNILINLPCVVWVFDEKHCIACWATFEIDRCEKSPIQQCESKKVFHTTWWLMNISKGALVLHSSFNFWKKSTCIPFDDRKNQKSTLKRFFISFIMTPRTAYNIQNCCHFYSNLIIISTKTWPLKCKTKICLYLWV